MKRSEQDRLLRELLADASVERLRDASLARGLAAVRQRRQRRAILTGAATSLALAAAVFVALHHPSAPVAAPAAARPATPHVTMIDDAQLLALFADRSVALVGPAGEQKLLFLDAAKNPTAAHAHE